jgi:hypothetical protein
MSRLDDRDKPSGNEHATPAALAVVACWTTVVSPPELRRHPE